MAGKYIYAIITTGSEMTFDVAGLDGRGDPVYAIPHGDIAAVVGASPLADYRGLKREEAVRYLVVHQGVMERLLPDFSVLPVKFGTVLPDETWVLRLLVQGEALFRTALEGLAGLIQMEVVVLWNLPEVFREIGQEEPIAQLKAEVARRPPQDSLRERVALGEMVARSLETRRSALRGQIIPRLGKAALDLMNNPVMDEQMVANAALLIGRRGQGALFEELQALDEEFGGQLCLRAVGPLPLYNFATVEVGMPNFPEVERARRQLALGKVATPGEIRRAYHRLAWELHPDHNAANTQEEMAALTEAYRLLAVYAENRDRAAGAVASAACPFDRQAVEETLLIAIRGKEVVSDVRGKP